jgi:hypothetical protein
MKMNIFLTCGIAIVNIALIAYTVAFFYIMRGKRITNKALTLLSVGVSLDMTSTSFMIFGSSHSFLSTHGLLGYSALLAMLIDCILLWSLRIKQDNNAAIPLSLHRYTRIAYIWWIAAYVAGAAIVAAR